MQPISLITVLVVEDDQNISELIRLYIESQGYRCIMVANCAEALDVINRKDTSVDIIILDLMPPGIDGWEVCRRLRKQSSVPVIILTAKSNLQDKLKGFNLGADDYVVKPFDPLELVARIKAVLRRSGERPQRLELSGLVIDLNSFTVKVRGKSIELTPRETEILYFLACHPDRVFTREFLLQELWGFDFAGSTRTVDVHINRIREKLESFSKKWQIKTVWGVGYKFVLEEENETYIR